jgi:hypothetical protein
MGAKQIVDQAKHQIEAEERNGSGLVEQTPEDRCVIAISGWAAVDLDPILRGEQATPPPSVFERDDGVRLFYAACVNALFGESESLKSWIVAVITAQLLVLGQHVIYIDCEDGPETLIERLRALGVTIEQIRAHLTYINPAGPLDELAQAVVQEAIDLKGAPALAVIDGVTEAMTDIGLDLMSGTDVAAYYAGSPKWLARTGVAVCLVDHVTKSQEGRGRWAIGSERKLSGLTGAPYSCEAITPFGRGKTGTVKITVAKDRRGHVRRHADARGVIVMAEFKSWPDDGVTATFAAPETSHDGAFRPTYIMGRLSEAIGSTPGLTTRALRAAVSGKHDVKDLALELLVTEGFVEVVKGDRGARLHHSKRPFVVARDGDLDEAF